MNVWVRYNEKATGDWYDDPKLCPVAPVFRLGIYLINDMVRLFGEAERVQVMQSRLFTGRPTPDNAQLSILFRNGVVANVFASFCIEDGDIYQNGMTLNFENGTVYRNVGPLRGGNPREDVHVALVRGTNDGGRKPVVEKLFSKADHSAAYQWDVFARAIRGETIPGVVAPEQIVAGLRIVEAMAVASQGNGIAMVLPVE